ncbi:MAG TPA: hypothetical protein VHF69_07280, partial [Candidatus Synoicihabitans sp.]|nr:hypothetical protein [Candidatus Synoicihabitans sp.]
WLCSQLIETPVGIRLGAWLATTPPTIDRAETIGAVWLAAQRCGDTRAADLLARRLANPHGIQVPAWPRVLDRAAARTIATRLPLPREVVSALARSAAATAPRR